MYLGAHMSISGGLELAVERIADVGGTALQIFSRNQRQWKVKPLTDAEIEAFKTARDKWGGYPVSVHDSYLINMASPEDDKRSRSENAFSMEMRRTENLGIEYLVTHPGSHLGKGTEYGIELYARTIDLAIEKSETAMVTVLLENTAGQGTNLGSTFEELAEIMEKSKYPERLGICFDTCHAFAAGHDFRTPETYKSFFERVDTLAGLDKIKFFHLNDSLNTFGSRKDRHTHIGRGEIGPVPFGLLLKDEVFLNVPKVIETPKKSSGSDELEDDRINLRVLRELAGIE